MAVARGKRYMVRRSKDDRQIIWGRRAKRLGKHPLGEFTATASTESLTGITVIDEQLTLASGGNVYALTNIPFDRFYTRTWDANRTLSGEDGLIANHTSRDAVIGEMNNILGNSLSAAAPTELSDYKPDLGDNDVTYMAGQRIDLTPTVATASKAATMIIWDRPSGETWPNWLTQESDITGRVTGTAPGWTGSPGDGSTDDYEFCLKAGNPFGQAPTAKWMLKVRENTFTTPWEYAIELDSNRDRLQETAFTALSADALANPIARNSNGDGRAWTVGMVFKDAGDGGFLFSYLNSFGLAQLKGIEVKRPTGGYITLQYGGGSEDYVFLSTTTDGFTMQSGNWYGLCFTFDGGTTGANLADVEDYYSRFKFYTVDLDESASHTVTERDWLTKSHSDNGYTGPISGSDYHLSIGSRYANSNCIAGSYSFFGILDTCLTATSDIQKFITDPLGYKTDKTLLDGANNKIWLMGDGDEDEWTSQGSVGTGYLRNQVDISATAGNMAGARDYTLIGRSMATDDLVTGDDATIPSLGN